MKLFPLLIPVYSKINFVLALFLKNAQNMPFKQFTLSLSGGSV